MRKTIPKISKIRYIIIFILNILHDCMVIIYNKVVICKYTDSVYLAKTYTTHTYISQIIKKYHYSPSSYPKPTICNFHRYQTKYNEQYIRNITPNFSFIPCHTICQLQTNYKIKIMSTTDTIIATFNFINVVDLDNFFFNS